MNCIDCGVLKKSNRGVRCFNCSTKSPEKRRKLSEGKIGIKNPLWKGDSVGYIQLHDWVKVRMPAKICAECGATKNIDLANKGIYSRDLNNWEWLCRSHHMRKDGRIKNLKHQV